MVQFFQSAPHPGLLQLASMRPSNSSVFIQPVNPRLCQPGRRTPQNASTTFSPRSRGCANLSSASGCQSPFIQSPNSGLRQPTRTRRTAPCAFSQPPNQSCANPSRRGVPKHVPSVSPQIRGCANAARLSLHRRRPSVSSQIQRCANQILISPCKRSVFGGVTAAPFHSPKQAAAAGAILATASVPTPSNHKRPAS